MSDKISITINGESRKAKAGQSIAELCADMGLNPEKLAVEHNLEIVPRSTLGDVQLHEGDTLEIVHFVGGG